MFFKALAKLHFLQKNVYNYKKWAFTISTPFEFSVKNFFRTLSNISTGVLLLLGMDNLNRVWVGGLVNDCTEQNLLDEFEKFGEVATVWMYPSRSHFAHHHHRFAFVSYSEHKSAGDAIELMNDSEFMGRRIKVNWAHTNNREDGDSYRQSFSKASRFNDEQANQRFYGDDNETSYHSPYGNHSQRSHAYFYSKQKLKSYPTSYPGGNRDSTRVFPRLNCSNGQHHSSDQDEVPLTNEDDYYASHRQVSESNHRQNKGGGVDFDVQRARGLGVIWVGGLHVKCDRVTLLREFKCFGDILRVRRICVQSFGFVYFQERQSAKQAIDEMDGALIMGIPITVRWARDPHHQHHGGGQSFYNYHRLRVNAHRALDADRERRSRDGSYAGRVSPPPDEHISSSEDDAASVAVSGDKMYEEDGRTVRRVHYRRANSRTSVKRRRFGLKLSRSVTKPKDASSKRARSSSSESPRGRKKRRVVRYRLSSSSRSSGSSESLSLSESPSQSSDGGDFKRGRRCIARDVSRSSSCRSGSNRHGGGKSRSVKRTDGASSRRRLS